MRAWVETVFAYAIVGLLFVLVAAWWLVCLVFLIPFYVWEFFNDKR